MASDVIEIDELLPGAGAGDDPAVAIGGRRAAHRAKRGVKVSALARQIGVRWERLTPAPLDDLEFMELVYRPGAESHPALYRHPGIEMVLVLSGKLVIHLGFERYELDPGDSICFPSTTPHRYLNPTEETTRAVTVILPDGGMHGPPTNQRRP